MSNTLFQVSKDDTIILDGDGDKSMIEDRCQIIREAAEKTQSDYEKEKLQERLAKIAGGVAVIKVKFFQFMYLLLVSSLFIVELQERLLVVLVFSLFILLSLQPFLSHLLSAYPSLSPSLTSFLLILLSLPLSPPFCLSFSLSSHTDSGSELPHIDFVLPHLLLPSLPLSHLLSSCYPFLLLTHFNHSFSSSSLPSPSFFFFLLLSLS